VFRRFNSSHGQGSSDRYASSRFCPQLVQDCPVPSTAQPSPDDSRSARGRGAILRATADLLDEAGFASMTIDEAIPLITAP
jgi:hypothetical protein